MKTANPIKNALARLVSKTTAIMAADCNFAYTKTFSDMGHAWGIENDSGLAPLFPYTIYVYIHAHVYVHHLQINLINISMCALRSAVDSIGPLP